MSNSKNPYTDLSVTPEEEEAWSLLAARESLEIQEREAKKAKTSLGSSLLHPPLDGND